MFCLLSPDRCCIPSECRLSALRICRSITWLSSDWALILVHMSSFVILTAYCQIYCGPGRLHIVRNTFVEVSLNRKQNRFTLSWWVTLYISALFDYLQKRREMVTFFTTGPYSELFVYHMFIDGLFDVNIQGCRREIYVATWRHVLCSLFGRDARRNLCVYVFPGLSSDINPKNNCATPGFHGAISALITFNSGFKSFRLNNNTSKTPQSMIHMLGNHHKTFQI